MVFLFVILTVGFNILFARHLPLAEGIILSLHVFGFFAFLITLWVMADHAPASKVFTEFQYAAYIQSGGRNDADMIIVTAADGIRLACLALSGWLHQYGASSDQMRALTCPKNSATHLCNYQEP